MQLPVTGHPLHTRSLTMAVTLDEGGRWRAQGEVIDLRKTGIAPMPTSFQPAGIIHRMTLDLRIHPETLAVESLDATLPVIAVEASERSGGECCRDPLVNLDALVGEPLGTGFSKKLSLAFGGARGCSHLLALFHFMAAAVPRALELEHAQERAPGVRRDVGECAFQRSLFIDGFQNADHDIELAIQLGDYQTRPEATLEGSRDRLHYEQDVRLYARVGARNLVLQELRVADRERDRETPASAPWRERPAWAGSLVDAPIAPGLATRSMQICGSEPDKRLLLAALLQLAPAHFQVMAALSEQWAPSAQTQAQGETSKPLGGMTLTANGYMWRADGPLHR